MKTLDINTPRTIFDVDIMKMASCMKTAIIFVFFFTDGSIDLFSCCFRI